MSRLSDRTLRWIGYVVMALTLLAAIANVWLSALLDDTADVISQTVLGLTFGAVLFVTVRAQPRNGAVWALALGAFGGGSSATAQKVVELRMDAPIDVVLMESLATTAPSELDVVTSLSIYWASWAFIAIFVLSIHLVLLFPDGRLSARPWRLVVWGTGAAILVVAVQSARYLGPWVDTPFDEEAWGSLENLVGVLTTVFLVLGLATVVQLIVDYRRSSGITRLQYRWFTFALLLNAVPWWTIGPLFLPDIVIDIAFTVALGRDPDLAGHRDHPLPPLRHRPGGVPNVAVRRPRRLHHVGLRGVGGGCWFGGRGFEFGVVDCGHRHRGGGVRAGARLGPAVGEPSGLWAAGHTV